MMDTSMLAQKEEKTSAESVSKPELREQPLSDSQSRYNGLFLHMNDGFAYCKVIFDQHEKPEDYAFIDVNEAFRRLTKIHGTAVVGRKITEVIPGSKNESFNWVETCGSVALTGKSLTFERYCKTLNKWLAVNTYCPEKGYFAMIVKDITQRKKTEQALKQSEKQYKQLASSITDLFFALDSCLKITYWNKTSEKFTGISAENVVKKHFYEVFGKDRLTRKAVRIYLEVMRRRKSHTFIDKLPKVNNAIFEIQVYPSGDGISVFAKDITGRRKLQGTMEQYTKRLEELVKIRTEKLKGVERLAAIGETAGMIGHDIRNPLQSIIGELYLAKDELNTLPESEEKKNIAESIHSIEEQTIYINKIVTDLQDYAKPLTPTIQETDLEELIRALLPTLDAPHNIQVSLIVHKDFPTIKTDPSFIKRILTNLILNGVQAMQEKGGGELIINAFPRGETVIIAVSDTGVGIPEAVREKIFKPLFTTKSKGQGFGLAVVKKLVEALNGHISFETQVEKGTTFIIELPLKDSTLST
jgi:PAS domain S-box-containing protein